MHRSTASFVSRRLGTAMLLLGLGIGCLGGCPAEDEISVTPKASPSTATTPTPSPTPTTPGGRIDGGIPTMAPTATPNGSSPTPVASPTLAPIITPVPAQP